MFRVTLQACGLALLEDLMALFGYEPDPDVPSQPVMQQYQAQARASCGPLCFAVCCSCDLSLSVVRCILWGFADFSCCALPFS